MDKLWSVTHMYMCGTSGFYHGESQAVRAKDEEEALAKFNAVAEQRSKYPYYWEKATIDNVKPLDIIE